MRKLFKGFVGALSATLVLGMAVASAEDVYEWTAKYYDGKAIQDPTPNLKVELGDTLSVSQIAKINKIVAEYATDTDQNQGAIGTNLIADNDAGYAWTTATFDTDEQTFTVEFDTSAGIFINEETQSASVEFQLWWLNGSDWVEAEPGNWQPGTPGHLTLKSVSCLDADGNEIVPCDAKHSGYDTYVVGDVEATCTEDGATGDEYCSNCDELVKASEVIPALGHTEKEVPAVEATCKEAGLTAGTVCSVCGEVLVAQKEVAALGHEYDEETHLCVRCGKLDPAYCLHENEAVLDETTVVEATCEEDGYTGDMVCPDCDEVMEKGEVIPALGHTEKVLDAVAATCTEDGLTEGVVCSVCDKVIKAQEVVKATGHVFGEWEVTKEPTVEAEGEKTRKCTVCGEVETEAIPKLEAIDEPDDDKKDDEKTEEVATDKDAEPTDTPAAPTTGDNTMVYALALIAVAALGGVAYTSKKRA